MIEILKFEMVNKGKLIARFNAKILKWGGIVIKDCTLFEGDGKKWINLPSRQYEVDGKKKYAEYLGYEDRELNDKFKASIMEAAQEMRSRHVPVNLPAQQDEEGDLPF